MNDATTARTTMKAKHENRAPALGAATIRDWANKCGGGQKCENTSSGRSRVNARGTALKRRCDKCTFSLSASTNFERSKILAKYVGKLEVSGKSGRGGDA